jgi:hypothetical protein
MVQFRNIDFDQSLPLDEWPAEAIGTMLDRGSSMDWRRVVDAVRASNAAEFIDVVIVQLGQVQYPPEAMVQTIVDALPTTLTAEQRDMVRRVWATTEADPTRSVDGRLTSEPSRGIDKFLTDPSGAVTRSRPQRRADVNPVERR